MQLSQTLLPRKEKQDIILFFKYYDASSHQIRFLCHLQLKYNISLADVMPKLKMLCGFSDGDPDLEVFEEYGYDPSIQVKMSVDV
jgi:hypothetical protein